jgi:IPT/TIG domain
MDQIEQEPETEVGSHSIIGAQSYDEAATTVELPVVRPRLEREVTSPLDPPTWPGTPALNRVGTMPTRWVERSKPKARRSAPRWLRFMVLLLALCAAASSAGVVALHERPSWFEGLRNFDSSASDRHFVSLPRPASTTTLPISTGAGNLAISSLEPPTGSSGAQITVLGSHLFGPGGYLAVVFNGSAVPTRCPSEAECTAVVPPASRGTTAIVRVESHRGMSNGLTFRYQ